MPDSNVQWTCFQLFPKLTLSAHLPLWVLSSHPDAAGELITFSFSVCAGFWRLLSLQASCRGEESCVWPLGDAHQTAERTTGKTVVSSLTAHCSITLATKGQKTDLITNSECVYHKKKGCQRQWQLVKLFSPRGPSICPHDPIWGTT